MRILVTGGCGYLGGRLTALLAADLGHHVVVGTRRMRAATWLPQGVTLMAMDWSLDTDLRRACEGMDTVVHLAGMTARDCAADPVAALEFNALATARLVRAAVQCRVRRFVCLSSAHVYGAALAGSVDERTMPVPRHAYATSHRAAEDAVRLAHLAGTIESVTVRLSNTYGAPAGPDGDCWSLVTNDLCRQAIRESRAVLRGSGRERRDFIPMAEACRAIIHLMTLPSSAVGDGLFNVGSGWAPTLIELADLIADRVQLRRGTRPQVLCATAQDEREHPQLHYGIGKLLASGFMPQPERIVAEVDELIEHCARDAQGGLA